MADECDVSKIVTWFLLNTCRAPRRLTRHNVDATVGCAAIATERSPNDEEAEKIVEITGSVAEFYIEPMLPLFGDIDIMYYYNNVLAIPQGHPPPTQLPDEFLNYVYLFEIIDSHLPGYVYVDLCYLLTQCIDDGKYNCVEYDKKMYLAYALGIDYDETKHGPARRNEFSQEWQLPVDTVFCVRCLVWPPQAACWPTRHRNYGRPDSATLDRVVSNGCDVVGVAHRQCRQHEFMGKCQWRLSFSRAEIVLINSWMPLQQIVYHMLRFFIKTERLTECADNSGAGTWSNYHIKTLMLWACELKPTSWWTENLNLVRICVELLQTLSVWLTDTHCPHYFINNCNLLDISLTAKNVARKHLSVNEEYFSTWFVNNYIGLCAQLCPDNVSGLFNDVSTRNELRNAVSEIVIWRVSNSMEDLWRAVKDVDCQIATQVSRYSVTKRSHACWMKELAKIDERSSFFLSAVVLLRVASKVSRNAFTEEFSDILATILPHNFNQCCGVLSLHKRELNASELVELLQTSAVLHMTAYRQLVARDFGSIVTVVTTDFEAMHACKRGDYQRCLQLSTQNVHTLLNHADTPNVPTLPEFIQLLDDDIVSLTALTLIVNPQCRDHSYSYCVSQLPLSLYLMTECQLMLRHSVTSLAQTLGYIKVGQRIHPHRCTLDHLTLKLTEHKATEQLYAELREKRRKMTLGPSMQTSAQISPVFQQQF